MSIVVIVSAVAGAAIVGLAAWMVWSVLQGQEALGATTMRQAFVRMVIMGFVACAITLPIRVMFGSPWWRFASVFTITVAALGVATLILTLLTLVNARPAFMATDRQSLLTVGGVILAKWVVATLHLFAR